MNSFDDFSEFLCNWYECNAADMAGPEGDTAEIRNPILREFHARFGALAQRHSRFRHPGSDLGPLSAQDHFFPPTEIRNEDGFETFLIENQGNFVAAAGDEDCLFVKGDISDSRFAEFAQTGIPLVESLVANALQETVMSVGDRSAVVPPPDRESLRAELGSAKKLRLRTVHDDNPYCFFLTPDIIAMGFADNPEFFAHRGQWRLAPP